MELMVLIPELTANSQKLSQQAQPRPDLPPSTVQPAEITLLQASTACSTHLRSRYCHLFSLSSRISSRTLPKNPSALC